MIEKGKLPTCLADIFEIYAKNTYQDGVDANTFIQERMIFFSGASAVMGILTDARTNGGREEFTSRYKNIVDEIINYGKKQPPIADLKAYNKFLQSQIKERPKDETVH